MQVNRGTRINRDFILDRVPEKYIFEKYLGLSVSEGINYTNSLRKDINPGCRFYVSRKTGRLKFNDFGRKSYDCFDVVQERFGLNFSGALKKVAYDFKLSNNTPKITSDKINPVSFLEAGVQGIPTIGVATREFSYKEKAYWSSYGLTGKQLKKFNVFALKKARYTRGTYSKVLYIHKDRELAFCYYIEDEWKLYFPERSKNRFYQVSQIAIQGYKNLPKTGISVVITKSYKDVIGFDTYSISAIAPQSENILLDKLLIEELKERFDNVYILYDNDWAGKRAMVKRVIEFTNLIPLCFAADQAKDLTDNMKKFGVDYVGKIIKQYIK